MLSNIFVRTRPLLEEKKYPINIDKFIEFMGRYSSNAWVYPAVLRRELKIDMKMVYQLLEVCRELGLLKQYLELYCPNCQRYSGYRYETLSDLPEEIECQQCGDLIEDTVHYAIVIYRVCDIHE